MLRKLVQIGLALLIASASYAADEVPIALEHVKIDLHNRQRIVAGGKYFAQNCMACHTMKYLQHNKIAEEAGVILGKMPLKKKEWWLGAVPPDLTLLARVRSPDWIYTYLHSFYKDDKRPTGYNNLLVKDINMPNLFAGLQGVQELVVSPSELARFERFGKPRYYTLLKLVRHGSMTPEQFDGAMTDLVTFFVYAADPERAFRIHMGVWSLVFLFIFLILTYMLKKAYWKDVPKNNKD